MLNKLKILFAALFVSASLCSTAQLVSMEYGGMLGGSSYYGDVNNQPGLSPQEMRGSVLLFARIHPTERFAFRANLAYARIVGIDSLATKTVFQRKRNLNFYSDVFEASFQAEFNLIEDRTRGRRIKSRNIPYIFGGIGFFHFIPKTIFEGQVYNLVDYNTAGVTYSQNALCFPIGIGIRRYVTPNWLLGIEFGARFTTTSFLDDIDGRNSLWPDSREYADPLAKALVTRSRTLTRAPGKLRGKMEGNDIYFLFGITLSHKQAGLGSKRFQGKAIRCPRFY